jgi:hypothetical protein
MLTLGTTGRRQGRHRRTIGSFVYHRCFDFLAIPRKRENMIRKRENMMRNRKTPCEIAISCFRDLDSWFRDLASCFRMFVVSSKRSKWRNNDNLNGTPSIHISGDITKTIIGDNWLSCSEMYTSC